MVVEVPKNNEKRICGVHTHSNFQVAQYRAASQWVVQIVDGRYALSMAGMGYRWVVQVWSLGSVGLVAGWSLASLAIVGSLGGVGPVVGSLLGSLVVVVSLGGATHH